LSGTLKLSLCEAWVAHRLGTGAPQSRQTTALKWRGLPHLGQTRRPASTLPLGFVVWMTVLAAPMGLPPLLR
jgi:hypothetical protein